MTISTETGSPDLYTGDGVTTDFATSFKIIDENYVLVFVQPVGSSVPLLQELNVDYTVSGVNETFGSVDFMTAPADGSLVSLELNVPATQTVDYTNDDAFDAETTEGALDKLTLLVQQYGMLLALCPRFMPTNTSGVLIPSVEDRADKLFGFDSEGSPVAVITGRAQVNLPTQISLIPGQADYLLDYEVSSGADLFVMVNGNDIYTSSYEVVDTLGVNQTIRFLFDLTEYKDDVAEIRYIGNALLTGQVADGAINDPDKFANRPVDLAAMAAGPAGTIIQYDASGDPAHTSYFPVGAMIDFGGAVAPDGFSLCAGAEVSRVGYSALFAVIGTAYGSGDGVATFNLPDRQTRAPYGVGQGRTREDGSLGRTVALGDRFGAENYTQKPTDMSPHDHDVLVGLKGGDAGTTVWANGTSQQEKTEKTPPDGTQTTMEIVSPGLGVNVIIYHGVYS